MSPRSSIHLPRGTRIGCRDAGRLARTKDSSRDSHRSLSCAKSPQHVKLAVQYCTLAGEGLPTEPQAFPCVSFRGGGALDRFGPVALLACSRDTLRCATPRRPIDPRGAQAWPCGRPTSTILTEAPRPIPGLFCRLHDPFGPRGRASEVVLNLFSGFGPEIQCAPAHAQLHRLSASSCFNQYRVAANQFKTGNTDK